jgi:hypothetical protein
VDRCAPRSSIHEADAILVGGRADPTANSCTGNCDEALRKKCSETEWFSHRSGTRRLHATYYEASTGIHMGESGRNCQAPGHLGKNSQSQFASHRLCRWLFVLQPRSARIRPRDQIESEDSRSCGSTTVPSAVAAFAPAGNCSTVARWPSHKRVTSTTCPSGNSSAS